MLRMIAALALVIAMFAVGGEVSRACGCVDWEPMTKSEIDVWKRRADNGEILATGKLWFEFRDVQRNDALERYWRFRAIRAGDPRVTERRASHWLNHAADATDANHKRVFIDAAVALLDRGFPNRRFLDSARYGGISEPHIYVARLRLARAAQAVLRDGLGHWSRRAERDDADGAYHMAAYYRWIEPNEERHQMWVARASALRDPDASRRQTTPSPMDPF